MDFMDFDGGSEPFDYILCHGVFSWVPVPVQQRVLQLCQRHLAANGIAYISYNLSRILSTPTDHGDDALPRCRGSGHRADRPGPGSPAPSNS